MGPLKGLKIVEMAGIGPGPFACMMLADMGADVIRVERRGATSFFDPTLDPLGRGRRSIGIDLKKPEGLEVARRLIGGADVLIEGFRPGVMERNGLGPDECLELNPRLVYGRMTGWGQDGPWASMAGHDINYISLSGALNSITRHGGHPVPPLNLVGDFGGGSMFLVAGVLAALFNVQRNGIGQVVDTSMVEGSAYLLTMMYGFLAQGIWQDKPGTNLLDTGAHFYDVYETSDGLYVSVGAIEGQFYKLLLSLLELDPGSPDGSELGSQMDRASWSANREHLARVFASKSRDEWAQIFENTDACAAPVLSMTEAPQHPHNISRGSFFERGSVVAPSPAPKFSKTPSEPAQPGSKPGADAQAILCELGYAEDEIAVLRGSEVI